ncbi:AAA domain-containing protein [Risungbinella massiliensis]|uniref:AAA domain-containing protein n=1 Tax=Risungbinella massiliensis TaxID=1329796 RepID=UPI0005CC6767|nr:AAA domain-containing protein [Risungbinella massiliensis]
MSQIRNRLSRVFEYLREVKGSGVDIVRDLKKFEGVWWQTDLHHIRGVSLGYNQELDGAWMTVQRPFIPVPPALPEELEEWIPEWSDPEKIPEPLKQVGDRHFADEPILKEMLDEWIGTVWSPWADDAKVHWRTKRVYDELFSFYHQLVEEEEEKEIAWGHGLLTWKVEDWEIQRHLLVTPLEIDFDSDTGVFRLTPKAIGTTVETDMLSQVHFSNAKKLHETIEEMDLSLNARQEKEIAPFLQKVIHLISPDGQYYSTEEPYIEMWESPRISYTPALFIRKATRQIWVEEIEQTGKALENGLEIPSHIARLVSTDEEEILEESLPPEDWSSWAEDVLYPMPSNSAQRQVLERLAKSDGVVVQGAPGTGKSHTIVNVAAHLLAHGKRVLITSEKERSLEVLTEMIPEELRPLCVRMIGGDQKAVKELEHAIRFISEGLEVKRIDQLKNQAAQTQVERIQVKAELEEIESLLEACALLEHEEMLFSGQAFTAVSATKWLQDHPDHNWFPDRIMTQEGFPLTHEEQKEFSKLLQRFSQSDFSNLLLKRPSPSEIPTPNAFRSIVQELHQVEEQYSQSERTINDWNTNQNIAHLLPSALHSVEQAIQELHVLTQYEWQLAILKDETLQERWRTLLVDFREKSELLQVIEHNLLEYEFTLPTQPAISQMKQDVQMVLERMRREKRVGRFFRQVIARKTAYLFRDCLVNNKPPETIEEFEVLAQQLDRLELRHRVVLKWNRLMQSLNGPSLEMDHPQLTMVLDELLQQVEYLLSWQEQIIQPLLPVVQSLGIPVVDWFNVEWHQQLHQGLKALELATQRERLQQAFHQLHQKLLTGQIMPQTHPIWGELLEACQLGDVDKWSQLYKELAELEKAEPAYRKFQEYLDLLKESAPSWLATVLEQSSRGEVVTIPMDIEQAWMYSQLTYYVEKVPHSGELRHLEKRYHELQNKEEKLVRKLISYSAWVELLEKTTEVEKRSLITWLQLMRKINAGSGKHMEQYRQEAKKELKNCKNAVPIWIMPVQKVMENFYLDDQPFDLIIVDESSQSSLFSLSLLLRSRKFMVVGDENQISPDTDLLEHFNRDLMTRYLYDIPQATQLDTSVSLYDTASRIFQEKAILKEHFRSVPPIFSFNNQLMYGEEIIALRPLEKNRLPGRAMQSVYVPNLKHTDPRGNKQEAEAIIEHIRKMLQDPLYDQKTIGIISLENGEQVNYLDSLIKQHFSEKEILERRLVVGDSYRFQGDERDVILLSMVQSEKPTKALTSEEHLRYYNVAISRARDQVILFHSLLIDDFPKGCVRRILLEQCLEQEEQQTIGLEKLESNLEREIYQILTEKDYKVASKVKVGWEAGMIDLLVQGKDNVLAIQIEGDSTWNGLAAWRDDLKQQRVLERIGWNFYRLYASRYAQNPEEIISALQERLLELGIEPVKPKIKEKVNIEN